MAEDDLPTVPPDFGFRNLAGLGDEDEEVPVHLKDGGRATDNLTTDANGTIVGVRKAGPLPWVLLALGVLAVVCAFWLRGTMAMTSRVHEITQASPGAPVSTKDTTMQTPPSDSVILGLVAFGGLLALAGAFYTRITKVTLPGGAALDLASRVVDSAVTAIKGRPEIATMAPKEVADLTAQVTKAIVGSQAAAQQMRVKPEPLLLGTQASAAVDEALAERRQSQATPGVQ